MGSIKWLETRIIVNMQKGRQKNDGKMNMQDLAYTRPVELRTRPLRFYELFIRCGQYMYTAVTYSLYSSLEPFY